nr:MAG TPA: holin protein [Caudoviricetes sp.]
MDDVVAIIIACLGSSGLTAIILAVLQRRWAKSDKQDAVVAGLKVLTVDRVRYLGRCYILDEKITLEDRENLEDMYRAYKALGGNGHLETIISEVRKLPISNDVV